MFRKYKSPFPQSLSFFVPTLFYLEYFSHHLVKSFRSVLSIICRYSFISTVTIYVLFLTILIRTASVSHMPEPAYMPIPSSPISSFSLNDLPMLKACVISDTSSIPFPWFRISRSLPRILISIDGDSPSIAFSMYSLSHSTFLKYWRLPISSIIPAYTCGVVFSIHSMKISFTPTPL